MLRESLEAGAADVDWQPVLASAMTPSHRRSFRRGA